MWKKIRIWNHSLSDIPGDFDDVLYLQLNPDVAQAGLDAKEHYCIYGKKEGRLYKRPDSFHPDLPEDFNEQVYLELNPDVASAGIDPCLHYLRYGRNEQRFYKQWTIPEMLSSSKTDTAHIEFTTRCNLRCVYCAVSQPTYRGTDLDLSCLDEILDTLKERETRFVYANGHGETTLVKGWDTVCRRMIEDRFALGIVTNFARALNRTEIETLARFRRICVSCDTVDAELFSALRRKARLSVLLENMERIRSCCRESGIEQPVFSWSCVVSNMNVLDLPRLIRTGMEKGVTHFEFCNMTKYDDLPDALNVYHISSMDTERMIRSRESILASVQIAEENGCVVSIQAGLLDVLEQRIADANGPDRKTDAEETKFARYAKEASEGMTRLCLDPWNLVYIHADGNLRPCCWHWNPLGKISRETSVQFILNSEPYRTLRYELLTGKLNHFCRTCPARPLGPIPDQIKLVTQYLRSRSASHTVLPGE